MSGDSRHADLLLDSTLESVDKAEGLVLQAARELGFDEDGQYEAGIAVRESMVNAVAHGNRYNARKKVHFTLWKGARRLAVEIEDEGRGFEEEVIPDPREGENVMRHSGRGLLMIRAYMDEFDIERREPSGTRVRMVKYLKPVSEAGAQS